MKTLVVFNNLWMMLTSLPKERFVYINNEREREKERRKRERERGKRKRERDERGKER